MPALTDRPVLLPPESLIRAHTIPLKREELARLEENLRQVRPWRVSINIDPSSQ
jgi:hypothetical protein